MKLSEIIDTDLLIVGGGIGGLSACVEAHRAGIHCTLITKANLGSGASYFPLKATLGIQVTGDEADKARFAEDIARVAAQMNNPKIVKAYIDDSPQAIELLAKIGFEPWLRNDNRPACFARYPRPIFLINAWKAAAERAKQIIQAQQTPYYEDAVLLHIVTDSNSVQGAIFSHRQGYIFCRTSHIILAAGGIAGLYKDNLYPQEVIGSSHAIALQAGAKLTNLEFIQFIPAFIEPKYKVLFGEHTLKYCREVTDAQGNNLFADLPTSEFQQMMTERSHYAPFSIDFACAQFDLRVMKALLDSAEQPKIYLKYHPELYQDNTEFYTVYLNWLAEVVGIDLLRDKIAIAPFAHSCNGGIEIDEWGESAVRGLFAVGEVSACIEGANRLGGNSVGGSLVFAKRAVATIATRLSTLQKNHAITPADYFADWLRSLENPQGQAELLPSQVLSRVRKQMAKFANVFRSQSQLEALLAELQQLARDFVPLAHHTFHGIEIYYALKTAQAVVQSMLARTESRGAHYRADFPTSDAAPYRLRVTLQNGEINVEKHTVQPG